MKVDHRPGSVRSNLVRMYREPLATPRFVDMPPEHISNTAPAPDWAWMLIDAILERASNIEEGGLVAYRALLWCKRGNTEARSEQLRTIIKLWPGPREKIIVQFLDAAEKTKAGRIGPTRLPRPTQCTESKP